ncbi:MAG: pantoate--beta-alanine ligase, partial [Mariprofundaceae bacterium]|nr:pantoate--beta-alanine ligase [Mariprofundaceae bacterium]
MKVIESSADIRHVLGAYHKENIAFVPTMGCLHEGHLSLIRQAKRLADIVVVSIYVNPLQFGQGEDLEHYPQPFDQDAKLCAAAGVDILFHPHDLYPEQGLQVALHVCDLQHRLCGASRKGHFDGVVTVVNILFNLIQPQIAIFGEKDFQQLSIIRRMVADLHMPIEIIEGETVREADGLAKSSRNRYLNEAEREQAAELSTALNLMVQAAKQGEQPEHIVML